MSSFWQKTVSVAGSVGSSIVDGTKSGVNAASFAVKHKTLSTSAGKDDEVYSVPKDQFLALRIQLIKASETTRHFIDSMKTLSGNCSDLGKDFMAMSNEDDPVQCRKCAEAYLTVMSGVDGSIRKPAEERLASEVVLSINAKVKEMDKIKAKIEARIEIKREYEHYYTKVSDIKLKPDKAEKDPSKIARNQSKLDEYTLQLERATIELLGIFDVYERARPNILKAEFETLRSAQKSFFGGVADGMNQFIITNPGLPGGGLSIEEIAEASGKSPASITYSLGGSGRRGSGTKGSPSETEETIDAPRSSSKSSSSRGPPPPPLPSSSSEICKVKMLYKFDGRSSDELTLAVGAIVSVSEKKPDGWYVGEFNGKKGLFPGNYSQEIAGSTLSAPSIPLSTSSSSTMSDDYTSMAMNAGIGYAKENPDQAKKAVIAIANNKEARDAVIGFAKSNPDLVKKGASTAFKSGGAL